VTANSDNAQPTPRKTTGENLEQLPQTRIFWIVFYELHFLWQQVTNNQGPGVGQATFFPAKFCT
jgi:hypothetical protein